MKLLGAEEEALAQGVPYLRLVSSVFMFSALMFIGNACLRGAGETTAPLLINGLGVWVVRVPAALLFTRVLEWGLTGAWIAMALDLTSRGLLLLFRFRSGKWKKVQV